MCTSFFKQTIVIHWTGFACWLWEMHVWLTISWGKILLALLLPARFVLKVCCHVSSHCFPHSHWSPSEPKAWRSFSEELGVETVWGDQSLCEILEAFKFTWNVFCRVFFAPESQMRIVASKLLVISEGSWIKTPNASESSKVAVNCTLQ